MASTSVVVIAILSLEEGVVRSLARRRLIELMEVGLQSKYKYSPVRILSQLPDAAELQLRLDRRGRLLIGQGEKGDGCFLKTCRSDIYVDKMSHTYGKEMYQYPNFQQRTERV